MDREKIMSALHCRAQDLMIDLPACDKCDYQIHMVNRNGCDYRRLCKDSISLLKEQEAEISRVSNEYLVLVGKVSKQPQIVRCEDCKHRPTKDSVGLLDFPDNDCPCQNPDDSWYSWYPSDNWFCADGEGKDK